MSITDTKLHDVDILDELLPEPRSIYVLSITLFEQTPISWAFTEGDYQNQINHHIIQLNLFDS